MFLRSVTLLGCRSLHASPRLALASASAASARPLPLLARRPLSSAPAPAPAPAQPNEPRTLSELPPKWRKLKYQELEVFDTTELRSLMSLLLVETIWQRGLGGAPPRAFCHAVACKPRLETPLGKGAL